MGLLIFLQDMAITNRARLKKREENKSKGVDGNNFGGKVFQWLEILLELVLLSISFHFDKQIEQKKKRQRK
jgi:hypothetical protein